MRMHLIAGTAGLLLTGAANAITIEFDYTYDTGNFFGADHRAVLDAVADEFGARITDSLAALESSGANVFRPSIGLVTGTQGQHAPTQSLAADTIRVFLGARDLGGNTLGVGGSGGFASTPSDFAELIDRRGQTGPENEDYATWGGSIVFDSDSAWYLDDDLATTEFFTSFDFYSVAIHELGHVLGVGTSSAWSHDIDGGNFIGAAAMAVYGGPVPLADLGHVSDSIRSTFMGQLQEPSLSADITAGQRKYFTDLDWALLSDIGWQVAAVPEAHSWAMMLAGLGLLGWRARRRA